MDTIDVVHTDSVITADPVTQILQSDHSAKWKLAQQECRAFGPASLRRLWRRVHIPRELAHLRSPHALSSPRRA
eukprot:12918029-Prorocentrum_lima.AAC.1